MKSGIIILAELPSPLRDRVHAVQERYDPRMARGLPPHVTIAGSSGMGPISSRSSEEELRSALEPITNATPPLVLRFGPPMRFMQTNVVSLPLDPHGPLRALHEAIRASGLRFEPPRFAFTPHCTLSFYPELTPARAQELLSYRFGEPFTIDRIHVDLTTELMEVSRVMTLSLSGAWPT
ncbi:MAG: hypothetical protein JWO05_1377 [Gemmatimonadetes bacterium]|nr:hypothetical protein [Gemmatimonadota bacterium]